MSHQNSISVDVESSYVETQSEPELERFVFAYTVTVTNHGDAPARLVSRHWVITDANGEVTEVQGQGVIGEQPYIEPGKSYQYSSGAVIATPIGTMEGDYKMIGQNGAEFKAPIPVFSLATPGILH